MQEPSAPPIEQISYTISPVTIPNTIYSVNNPTLNNIPIYDFTSQEPDSNSKNDCFTFCFSFMVGKRS